MKAEHRKELETNVLADQLGRAIEGLKQGPSRTLIVYLGVLLAILLTFLLFRYFMSSSEAAASGRWKQFDEAVFPEQIDPFLTGDLKDTPQGRLARFREARYHLAQGINSLAADRETALKHIEEATRSFEELSKSAGRVPLLHQEALAGAARGNETLGDLDQARRLYKRLAEEYPLSALGKDAKNQLERLDNPANQADLEALKKALSTSSKTTKE